MAWTHIRPYGNRVLVRLDKRAGKVEGTSLDLVIPELYRKQPQTGTIVAVGKPLVEHDGTQAPMQLAVGQRVLFGKWDGTPIAGPEHDWDGEYYMLDGGGLQLGPVNVDMMYGVVEDDGGDELTFASGDAEAAE